jgi:hypothetical protein
MQVTRVHSKRGHSRSSRAAASLQVRPPSSERNSREGQVPTIKTSGRCGTIHSDHTCMPSRGAGNFVQLSAPSRLMYKPNSLPR